MRPNWSSRNAASGDDVHRLERSGTGVRAGVLEQLQEDLDTQRLIALSLDLDRVFTRAGELSKLHTAKFLARSLDLLHVAAAHVASCTRFVSTDTRQLAVAKASGLEVVDIKPRIRRKRA